MLREYVNGKYKDDASISTTLVSLLRKVDKYFVELGIPLKEEAYKMNIHMVKLMICSLN